MELHEALKTVDATIGMFKKLHPVLAGDKDFLRTPVTVSYENYYDTNFKFCSERKEDFYHELAKKRISIVDIRPVCDFLVDEWPSPQTRQLRKQLMKAYDLCYEAGKNSLYLFAPNLYDSRWWEKEDYSFGIRNRETYDLYDALTDTLYEIYHAIKSTEEDDDRNDMRQNSKNDMVSVDAIEVSLHPDLQKRIHDSYNKSHQKKDIKTASAILYSEQAEPYWQLLKKKKFVNDDCHLLPKTNRKQAMLIAEMFAEKLNIKAKWKVFQDFWGINNLAQEKWESQQTGISPARQREIMSIFEK